MLDITNKTTDEINLLTEKYKSVLELIKNKKIIPNLAVVLDIGINYINEKYLDLSADWKSYTMLYIKDQYLNDKINNETDIALLIDNFIKYYNEEYTGYIDNLSMSASDYDRDIEFVHKFYKI
jgi:hypothetical protein